MRTRIKPGCTVGPDSARTPVPCLRIDGALAPLKAVPDDAAVVTTMIEEAAAWRPRSGYIGKGPPFARDDDPWFVWNEKQLVITGFWYPMFRAGTIQSYVVWGLYVEQIERE